jgi:carboxylesterase type B
MPDQDAGGCGSLQRSGPAGGAANGMPLNARTPDWIFPEDESITFAQGRQNPVDLIVGSNKDEHLSFGGNVATHATEIPYVFNNLAAPRSIPDLSSPRLASASEKDRELAQMISSYWVNFAKTGGPNGKNLPVWNRFEDREKPPHILGEAAEFPGPEILNKYDEVYVKLMASLTAAGKP